MVAVEHAAPGLLLQGVQELLIFSPPPIPILALAITDSKHFGHSPLNILLQQQELPPAMPPPHHHPLLPKIPQPTHHPPHRRRIFRIFLFHICLNLFRVDVLFDQQIHAGFGIGFVLLHLFLGVAVYVVGVPVGVLAEPVEGGEESLTGEGG